MMAAHRCLGILSLGLALLAMPASAETRLLVFSGWVGFRHETLPDGLALIRSIAATRGWAVEASEAPAVFSDTALARFDVVVWNNSCGNDEAKDLLSAAQKAAFERFLRSGKGTVGIHCASCLADAGPGTWTWFNDMLGALLTGHPLGTLQFQTARMKVEQRDHPATRGLPATWSLKEEWYDFDRNPRPGSTVLLSLDETSYQPARPMGDHPIAWCRTFQGGRVFYTGLGHLPEVFRDADFRRHLEGGIQWAAGLPDTPVTGLGSSSGGLPFRRPWDLPWLRHGRNLLGKMTVP